LRAPQNNGSVVYNSDRGTWNFLWWENAKRRSKLLGSIRELPTREAAKRAAEPLRGLLGKPLAEVPTIKSLIERYRTEKMPHREATRRGYEAWLRNHIMPRWGDCRLTDVQPYPVEMWLRDLAISPKSKLHVRGLLRILWDFAIWLGDVPIQRNLMELVTIKGATKRVRKPRSLTAEQFQALLKALADDLCLRTMVLVALSFGLRISEVLGLKWKDVDWLGKTLRIERGVVKQIVDDVKTDYSARTMAIADDLIAILLRWKQSSQFSSVEDWVFASPVRLGKHPLSYTHVWESLDRSAKAAGIGHISSHSFRHTYRSWLDSVGTSVGVQQKLMRHADVRTTMNIYGDAMTDDMREAGQKVVRMALAIA